MIDLRKPIRTYAFIIGNNSYKFSIAQKQIDTIYNYKEVVVNDSLFNAAVKANVSQKLIMQLIDIFCWDIDFALDIRKGDRFKILF